MKDFRVQQSEV